MKRINPWTNHLVLAVVGVLATTGAAAGNLGGIPVNTSDLDLSHPVDAAVLYQRIQRTAKSICANLPSGRLGDARKCVARTVDDAITQAAQPQLTAIHRKQTQQVARQQR